MVWIMMSQVEVVRVFKRSDGMQSRVSQHVVGDSRREVVQDYIAAS